MGFWNFLMKDEEPKEERSYTSSNYYLSNFLTGVSGNTLTEEEVMSIPTAKACRDAVIGTLKDLPIRLYKRDETGTLIEVEDDYRLELLNYRPNDFISPSDLKANLFNDLLLHGNAYVKINKKGNKVTELWNIPATEITINKYTDEKERYITRDVEFRISSSGGKLEFDEVMICVTDSKDGLSGTGVIAHGGEIFKLAINELELAKGMMENGSVPSGVLEVPTALSQDAGERLKTSWTNAHGGSKKASVAVLEQGVKYNKISLTPTELGLTTSRSTTGSEICRVFNVPEPLVDNTKNSYGTVEALNLVYIQYCLAPLVAVVEDALNRSLLKPNELKNQGYEFKIDVNEALKTTTKERYESYTVALSNGFMTLNEIRKREKMPLLDDELDFYKLSIGSMLYFPESTTCFNPNNSSTYNLITKEYFTPDVQIKQGMPNGENEEKENTQEIDKKDEEVKDDERINIGNDDENV